MDGMKNSWQVSGYRDWYDCYMRALTKDTRERFYICIQIVFVIMQVVIKP